MKINKLKNTVSSLIKDCKEWSEQEKVIGDAWFAMETVSELTYEQAVEILKILRPEANHGED